MDGVKKPIYTRKDGSRTFVRPECADNPYKPDQDRYVLLFEVLIFVCICIGICFLATQITERRLQRKIDERHSRITREALNDTI